MDEIRAMAGPVFQKHFEKVERERQEAQAKADAEKAKKAAEEEARKQSEAQKAPQESGKDTEMTDADAPKAEVEEAGDPE